MGRIIEGKNDLATVRPDILPFWDYAENNKLGIYPNKIGKSEISKAHFKCKKCGRSFFRSIRKVVNGSDTCPICTSREVVSGVNDLATTNPEVLKFWDYKKNNKLGVDPRKCSKGMSREVYWICPNCKKSFPKEIRDFIKGGKLCPICKGRDVEEGVNDLATVRPDILEYWDYKENKKRGLYPNKVTCTSTKSAKFFCNKCGQSYEQKITNRVGGTGTCLECLGQVLAEGVNDLATVCPEILPYWDYEKNNKLGIYPNKVFKSDLTQAYFKCAKCGRSFPRSIRERAYGKDICRVCTSTEVITGVNDLATTHPHLLKFWDYKENSKKGLDPTKLVIGSNKEAYWICEKCGKSYPQKIAKQVKARNMCQVCIGSVVVTGVNDLATTHPYVLKYWDYKKNNEKGIYPTKISFGSQTDVNWLCEQGHSTHSSVAKKIAQNCSCPDCNSAKGTSYPEQYLFYCFSKIFKEVYNRYDLYGKETDIYIKDLNIAIEYNGYKFHSKEDAVLHDKKKKEFWKSKGVHYIRILEVEKKVDEKWYIKRDNDGFIYTPNKSPKNICEQLNRIILIIVQDINRYFGKNYKFISEEYEKVNIKILEQLKKYDYEKSLAYKRPDLVKYWDYEQNGSLKPEHVYAGSEKEVYWKCENGHPHSYPLAVYRRAGGGRGCFYCSHQKLLVGFNDLATEHPELLDKWDYVMNPMKPTEVIGGGGGKDYWWKCEKGHSWHATVPSVLMEGCGCSVCSGRQFWKGFNDIETKYPQLVEYWDNEKNEKSPSDTKATINNSYYWKCSNCGKEWSSKLKAVLERIENTGCVCSNCAKKRSK